MKRSKAIVRAKLVVGYWGLILMESGAEFLAPQDKSTVRVAKEIPAAKKQKNNWWTEDNCPRMKKYLANSWYPAVRGQCDEACLELRLDPVPTQTVLNFYRGLTGSRSHTRITSLLRRVCCYQKGR